MSNECFVPKCKSSIGAPFPRDSESKHKWLEGLHLTHVTPKVGSFVCFAHFNSADLNEEAVSGTAGRRLSNRLKRGAVPCIRNPGLKKVDERLEESKAASPRSLGTNKKAESSDAERSSEVEKVCRACMTDKHLEAYIFDVLEDDITISSMLMQCVVPIEISEEDSLPKHICKSCLSTLKIASKFRKKCIETDGALRARYSQSATGKRKASVEYEPEESKKTKHADAEPADDPPCNVEDIGLSDAFEFIQDAAEPEAEDSPDENQQKEALKIAKGVQSEAKSVDGSDSDVNSASPTRRSRRLAHKGSAEESAKAKSVKSRRTKVNVEIDEIEKSLEEIHGQDSTNAEAEEPVADEAAVENINEGESLEQGEPVTTVEDILNTLEDGNTSKDVSESQNGLNEFLKKAETAHVPHTQTKIVIKSKFPITTPKKEIVIPGCIKLPKDVKIKPVEKFLSGTGQFPAVLRSAFEDNVFVQSDDYLFELGLVKGGSRHLRCTIPYCPAHGKQKLLAGGELDSIVNVLVPHNHRPPTEPVKKKQMFLCVMRKKMQNDRSLNIRHIYENACIEDPEIKDLVPLRNVINEICRHQLTHKMKTCNSFEDFFHAIETDPFERLHFTQNNQQFYQEKFCVEEDGSMAVVFGNTDIIQQVSGSKIMYIDASFKIDTNEDFKYQLVTVLVWIEDSYYPILYALVNKKSQLVFRKVFGHLHTVLAPELRPLEIITDYEANLYYALAEVYIDSNIGGSVYYYTQNLYKKICSLNLSRDLETNSYFRSVYHMLLMLPLLPVNTILDGLNNIELEARNFDISALARPIFDHVRSQWILTVTPELFCVHKLENRINENVIAPFKKLRDFLLLTKGKTQKSHITIVHVVEKIIELEAFLRDTYSKPDKKSFGRDLSSFQKKNVLRAWQFIEDHPKIEINNFFSKVLGYIKCMENQLWIWGFYRYDGDGDDILINASHFSIVSPNDEQPDEVEDDSEEYVEYVEAPENTIVMEAVIDQDGVLQTGDEILSTESVVTTTQQTPFGSTFVKYVYP